MSNDSRWSAAADMSVWRCRLRSVAYSVFFPLLFVVAVVAPFVVASMTPLALFEAVEYTLVAVGFSYAVGLAVLLR